MNGPKKAPPKANFSPLMFLRLFITVFHLPDKSTIKAKTRTAVVILIKVPGSASTYLSPSFERTSPVA